MFQGPDLVPKFFSNSLAVHVFHTCSGFFSLFPIWSPSPFTWIQRPPCATTVLAPNCSDRCSTQGLIASYTVKCGGGRKVRQRTPEIKLIMYLSVIAMNGLFSFLTAAAESSNILAGDLEKCFLFFKKAQVILSHLSRYPT